MININSYITKINDNIYQLIYNEDDVEKINKYIVLQKYLYCKNLSLDDLYLVRITKREYIPKKMVYFPLDHRNCYQYIDNPFKYIIGWIGFKIAEYAKIDLGVNIDKLEFNKNKLVTYRYRNTKHFSINGLASNIYHLAGLKHIFDDGDFIVIEPLKTKINDPRLVNLNPIDTFFDLSKKEMEISNEAIIILKESIYRTLDNDTLNSIGNRKIFLFEDDANTATDIVLLSLGVLPQHSKQQSRLEIESYNLNNKTIDDKLYLEKFQTLMENLNQTYLHQAYKKIPSYIIERREKYNGEMLYIPGILHSETPYFQYEQKKNEQADIKTYQDYMLGMIPLIDNKKIEIIRNIVTAIEKDVIDENYLPLTQNFSSTYDGYENELLDILLELSYPKFKQYTEDFNQKRLKKINKNRIG